MKLQKEIEDDPSSSSIASSDDLSETEIDVESLDEDITVRRLDVPTTTTNTFSTPSVIKYGESSKNMRDSNSNSPGFDNLRADSLIDHARRYSTLNNRNIQQNTYMDEDRLNERYDEENSAYNYHRESYEKMMSFILPPQLRRHDYYHRDMGDDEKRHLLFSQQNIFGGQNSCSKRMSDTECDSPNGGKRSRDE